MLQNKILVALAVAAAGTVLGCGSGSSQTQGEGTSESATDALTAVQSCSSQADACEDAGGDAGDDACKDTFRSCLGKLCGDGGAARGFADGSFGDDHDRDGGAPRGAGGATSPLFTAVDACLSDLGTCVSSGATPKTCADTAIACLKAALEPGASDDAGLPVRTPPAFDAGGRTPPTLPHVDAGAWPTKDEDAGLPGFPGSKRP